MRRIIAGVLLALLSAVVPALAQNFPCLTQICATSQHFFSAANTNSTNVTARQTALYNVVVINTTVTLYYLKFYDKATAPICGTDTPVATIPVPFGASNAGGGVAIARHVGLELVNGLGFCLTGAAADNDTSNAATGVVINLEFR